MFLSTRKCAGEQSFMLLFDVYKSRLFGYVLAITHSRYVAEEITQEVFLKLWLNRLELDKIDNPDAYIFAVARNKTLNYLRKANYDKKLLREIELSAAVSLNNNVEEKQAVSECDELLEKAITLLSPQRKQVYRLSRNEGLNHIEIARQLNISRNTVKNHLVETLRFIRKYLGKNGILLLMTSLSSGVKNFL
ncbi:MAG: RNA polymerase sigma-70 factor [Chitinophagaceae bacterium]|nr:RNA polymerase sigma-70 factor [Chitinophagaceae bacterium]